MASYRAAARSSPVFAQGVPLYQHDPIPGVTQPGAIQWLNPDAFVSTVDPSTGACAGGDSPATCQFGNLGRNSLRGPGFFWSDLYITKQFRLSDRIVPAGRRAVIQRLESPEFRVADGHRRHTRKAGNPSRFRCSNLHDVPAHRVARRRSWRRQFAPHDCHPNAARVLNGEDGNAAKI